MLSGRLLRAARRRSAAARRPAPASGGFLGLPDVPTLFTECDQDRDNRLYGPEAARLAQWLTACAPQEVVDGLFSATGSPQNLLFQDVEHVHAGIRKHQADNDVFTDPSSRVVVLHGARPSMHTVCFSGALATDAVGLLMFEALARNVSGDDIAGGFYEFVTGAQPYIDPASFWRAHFSMGRLQHVRGDVAVVGYGAGTFNEAAIERVDVMHHETTALCSDFDMSSPYLLPYPSEPPQGAALYPDAWMELAERIPVTGLRGPGVIVTRSGFIKAREHLPQQYFLKVPGFVPPLRIYEFAPIPMVEAAFRLVWPGDTTNLMLQTRAPGSQWQQPSPSARLCDVLGSSFRVCAAGHAVELNGGQPVPEYNPSLASRLWGSMRSI